MIKSAPKYRICGFITLRCLEVAAPPAMLQKEAKKVKKNPLFEKTPRSYRVGASIQPRVDLSRVVKWPKSRAGSFFVWTERRSSGTSSASHMV